MPDEPTDDAALPPQPPPSTAARRRPVVLVAVGALLVALVAAGIWWQGSRGEDDVADVPAADLAATVQPDGVAFGDAATVIDVFVDYQCPHCADLEGVIGEELASVVESGEATVLVRPVEFLSRASGRGAAALSCTAPTDQAFAMHAALLADIDGDFSPDGLTALAGTLGLDEEGFRTCLTDRETAQWVDGVSDAAREEQITSIPVVKVDGVRLNETQLASASAFRAAVETFGK